MMRLSLKIGWTLVGCIWIAVLGLTCWNSAKVDKIAAARDQNEKSRREMAFERRHADKFKEALLSHQAMVLPVTSVTLGLVELKSHLHSLAAAFDLDQVSIKEDTAADAGGQAPLSLDAHGTFEKTMSFLTVLQKIAYLEVNRVNIKSITDTGDLNISVAFIFNYTLSEPDPEKARQLQVKDDSGNLGANQL